jgi:predicted DNA-binding transcriptional regulator YafY
MATNKNATIRYQTLNRCFRNPGRDYNIDDLVNACNESLLDVDPDSSGVKKRQIYEDIRFMQDSRGFDAPIESHKEGRNAYYRYSDLSFSINNQPLNEMEAQQLRESLLTLSRFKGLPQFDWIEELTARLEQNFQLKSTQKVISFDENPFLTGREFIGELYNAIVNNKVLHIKYLPFKHEEIDFEVHPYHLKQFNNRWFLFGINTGENRITNIALDRIVSIAESRTPYRPNEEIDFEERFEDAIGVSIPFDQNPEKVILKIDKELWPYIKTKPLHGSQKIKYENNDFTTIELEVYLNYELESLILSFGEKMEVIEPVEFVMIMKKRIKELIDKYFKCAD